MIQNPKSVQDPGASPSILLKVLNYWQQLWLESMFDFSISKIEVLNKMYV
jgi:hypothetical protein